MTEDLHDLLSSRAERARPPQEPDDVVAFLAARAERHTRSRRNRAAVAGSAVVVVAAAAIGIVIADTGGTDHAAGPPTHQQVGGTGGGISVNTPNPSDATELPVLRPYSAQSAAASRRHHLEQARKAAAQVLERLRARERAAPLHPTLVKVAPAPPQAEISLGLAPKGIEYLSFDAANAFYGPAGLSPSDYFSKGIVVDVHLFEGSSKGYTLTVGGKPASYQGSPTDASVVRVRYDKRIDIGFQLPDDVHLTEAQALKMAAALDVRSTKHTTKG